MLGLLVLSVATAVGREGAVSVATVALLAVQAFVFLGLVAVVGTRLVERHHCRLGALHIRNAPFVVAMALCLGLAALAAQIGLAAIIGAFLAGMVFADTREELALERAALPVYELLVPFFF